ncbi:MAG: hypothetical protein U1E29_04165 [Coriobacteriia bacterium]|nr:hypothetical protein [Coriobacteriia bacterium]
MMARAEARATQVDLSAEEFSAKARAEIELADRLMADARLPRSTGSLFATALLVKGVSGPAETSGGDAISGPDGPAAEKALTALGFEAESVFRVVSRDTPGADARVSERLRLVIEAVDPDVVIALDRVAGADAARALGVACPQSGATVVVRGRAMLVLDGLEDALADEALKRRVWDQFRKLAPRRRPW